MRLGKIYEEVLSESMDLNFPEDYTKHTSKVEYVYSMGAMRPNGRNDIWFESNDVIEKKYRSALVKMKHLVNNDGSERGWRILSVTISNKNITIGNQTPNSKNVRKAVDDYYINFINYMDGIEVDGDELTGIINNIFGDKIKNIYSNSLYETAIRWLISRKIPLKYKRKILKQLMNEGLSIDEAISFWGDVR